MRWELAPRLRFDLVAFSGLNLSGERRIVEVHALGGRQGDLRPEDLKSCAIIGPIGLRVVFATSEDPDTWMQRPWRCVKLRAGSTFQTKEGRPCVRVPDLDWLDAFDARRTDPELQCSFDEATGLDTPGWTFGVSGNTPIKANVRFIRVDLAE